MDGEVALGQAHGAPDLRVGGQAELSVKTNWVGDGVLVQSSAPLVRPGRIRTKVSCFVGDAHGTHNLLLGPVSNLLLGPVTRATDASGYISK